MNKSNKKYIIFPKPHCNHFLFLFFFISSVLKQYILKDIKGKNNLSIPIFKLYVYDIGDFISLIPYLIIRKKARTQNNNIENLTVQNSKEDINFNLSNSKMKELNRKKRRAYLNMFFITILDFVAQISTVTYYLIVEKQNFEVKHGNMNAVLIFNIIALFLFSLLLLHTFFYRHHYFSFFITIACLIVIGSLDFVQIKNDVGDRFVYSIIYLAIKIFAAILYSMEDVLAKVMFLNYYYSPYSILLIKAIIQVFYLIIFSLPLCFIEFHDANGELKLLFSMFGNIFEKKIYILYYIIYLINSFFYNILNFILIDKFSANHSAISRIFENFGIFIINSASQDIPIDYNFGIRIIMYILLIIASFIFNEFLVINICGLANNTKLFLESKEIKDFSLMDDNNENEDIPEGIVVDNNDIYFVQLNNNNINNNEEMATEMADFSPK